MPVPYKFLKENKPWTLTYYNLRCRCANTHLRHFKCYKNIKSLIAKEEVKELWFRDKAYLMNNPSIDRINSSKDYTFDNCRFVELSVNLSKPKKHLPNKELKGIRLRKRIKKHRWEVYLCKNYENIYLGLYDNKEQAIKAYNEKAIKLFGRDAVLNKV